MTCCPTHCLSWLFPFGTSQSAASSVSLPALFRNSNSFNRFPLLEVLLQCAEVLSATYEHHHCRFVVRVCQAVLVVYVANILFKKIACFLSIVVTTLVISLPIIPSPHIGNVCVNFCVSVMLCYTKQVSLSRSKFLDQVLSFFQELIFHFLPFLVQLLMTFPPVSQFSGLLVTAIVNNGACLFIVQAVQ